MNYNEEEYKNMIKEKIIENTMNEIEVFNREIIDEAGGITVYNSNNIYISVQPDQGRNFHLDAYFKISWQRNFNDNSRVARISMRTSTNHPHPRYIYHNNSDGAKIDPRKIDLNTLLYNTHTTNGRFDKFGSITVWDALVRSIAEICNVKYDDIKNDYPKIDYSYIEEDKKRKPTKWGK